MIKIKSSDQIHGIKLSGQLAARTLEYLTPYVVAGISTLEINDLADDFIRKNGAISACLGYQNFPKSICTSINEVVCHGIPSNQILKDGDIVNIDVTTILNGYYGDTSTMYKIGNISKESQDLLDATKKCLDIGINQVFPGNYFGNIGYEIAKYAHSKNYGVVSHFCGHGTGCMFHEPPQIIHIAEKNSGPIMRPGMVFTIEPMINTKGPDVVVLNDGWTVVTEDGGLSAQYEHTVLVTDTGFEILTNVF